MTQIATWLMGDGTSGNLTTIAGANGTPSFTVNGTVIAEYDNGSQNNWVTWPNGPGGIIIPESPHTMDAGQTSATNVVFNFSVADAVYNLARAQGNTGRAY